MLHLLFLLYTRATLGSADYAVVTWRCTALDQRYVVLIHPIINSRCNRNSRLSLDIISLYRPLTHQVRAELYKLASLSLCSNTVGQLAMGMMVNPPKPGDPSYQTFEKVWS